MPEVSPSVLIIRLDAIGDALALTPLLAALRRALHSRRYRLAAVPMPASSPRARRAQHRYRGVRAALERACQSRRRSIALGGELNARKIFARSRRDRRSRRLSAWRAPLGAPVRIGFADPWGKPLKALWSRRLLTRTHLSQRRLGSARAARMRGALCARRTARRRRNADRPTSRNCGRSCSNASPHAMTHRGADHRQMGAARHSPSEHVRSHSRGSPRTAASQLLSAQRVNATTPSRSRRRPECR